MIDRVIEMICNDVKLKPHRHRVYVLAFPVQSHINPMLDFSKRLASSNTDLHVTFLITTNSKLYFPQNTSVTLESISDDGEEEEETNSRDFRCIEGAVRRQVTKFFIQLQTQHRSRSSSKLVVYDSVFPWMLDMAHQHGMLGASFFTQSCSTSAIYYHINQGLLSFPFKDQPEILLDLPFLPKLGSNDLPALHKVMDSNQTMLKVLVAQFSNLGNADFVLFNTFHQLELEVVQWMASFWTVKTIGPTHSLQLQHNDQMINLFEPNQEACTEWLDSKETGSVVYVSFGSLVSLEKSQIEELAWGLMMSKCNFLWVVRASEEHKLPPNITSLASERGLIVNWCIQTRVLAHRAVSCFLTHGGWNSTVEGLSYGVPLIVMAHWVDQTTNAKFVEDVWRVGVRVKCGENGIVSREEVCTSVGDVARGDKGRELKINATKLRRLAEEAVGDGGTTSKNIQDIVSRILCT